MKALIETKKIELTESEILSIRISLRFQASEAITSGLSDLYDYYMELAAKFK